MRKKSIAEELGFWDDAPTIEEILEREKERENEEIEPLSRYTDMWITYMREEHSLRMTMLKLEGELPAMIAQVDKEIKNRIEVLNHNYRSKFERPTEYLETVKYENQVRDYIEEIVLRELVFVER